MKRMTREKADFLHKLLLAVSRKIYDIDYGGCGIFVELLYHMLAAKGYRCKVICLDCLSGRSKADHLSNLRGIAKQDKDSVFVYNHICLQIGNYYFDSCRFEKAGKQDEIFNCLFKKLGQISIDKLRYLTGLEWKWNDLYDRSQNKRLKRLLSATVRQL